MTYDPFAPTAGSPNAFGKDKAVGYVVTGVVTEIRTNVQQTELDGTPKWWDVEMTRPMEQIVVVLQTDLREDAGDDGLRSLYVRGGKTEASDPGFSMQNAIYEAGKAVGTPVAPGGTLSVKYMGDAAPKKKGFDGMKLYKAMFKPGDPFAAPAAATPAPAPVAPTPPPAPVAPAHEDPFG